MDAWMDVLSGRRQLLSEGTRRSWGHTGIEILEQNLQAGRAQVLQGPEAGRRGLLSSATMTPTFRLNSCSPSTKGPFGS